MSDRILVGTRKGLFAFERGRDGWAVRGTHLMSDHVSMALSDPRDGGLYAGLVHGHFGAKLHRSRDGGKTWAECGTPAFPTRPEGAEPDRDAFGRELPWKLSVIWSLEPGGADEPGVLWCGTIPGALFRSIDGGDSWELMRSLWDDPRRKEWFGGGYDYPGIHSVVVDPRDARRVIVGVSCGGVWMSEDAGASWECRSHGMWAEYMPPERRNDPVIQDPHRVVQCRARPEVLWSQHHNGVFRTTDGAGSWTEVKDVPPSNFGFAVAVHPTDPETAWVVPAAGDERRIPVDGKVVVTRTRDGGRSFEVLSRGLPQEHAYDLTFRHGLDVDETGERLAFGSTTGSLWVSDNGGDEWTAVSHHLPPVHCVRFA